MTSVIAVCPVSFMIQDSVLMRVENARESTRKVFALHVMVFSTKESVFKSVRLESFPIIQLNVIQTVRLAQTWAKSKKTEVVSTHVHQRSLKETVNA